jgi:transmembrane sensor
MTASRTDPIPLAAAAWSARLRDDVDLDAWAEFQAWLEADPAHRRAYEEIEALWLDLEAPAAQAMLVASGTQEHLASAEPTVRTFRPRPRRPIGWLIAGGAIAASVVALVLAPRWSPPTPVDYATARGEVRAVTLADGSRLTLGGDTRLRVTLDARHREVALARGEAAFDVVHRPGVPFTVALGDQRVRVIGTEFNILRDQGRTAVTVRRGVVAVAQKDGGEVRLTQGQQATHTEGSTVQEVRRADPEAVLAWRAGKLIYDDAPLAQVVADFNRYGDIPIRVDPSAAGVKVSGVFFVDRQAVMVARLAHFGGLRAVTRRNDILLTRP